MKSRNRKNGLIKRVLSWMLALVMVISLAPTGFGAKEVMAADAYDLTVHYSNPNGWTDVYGYAWTGAGTNLAGEWPGTQISENAEHAGWYDLVLTDVTTDTVNFIFNNNNGSQTNNLSSIAGETELWCVGEVVTEQESWDGIVASTSLTVGDLVQVKVGDTLTTMDVYMNGVYETPVTETGDLEAVLYVNGEATDITASGTAAEGEKKVWRVVDGRLSMVAVEPAALVGNFFGLDFVDENGESYVIAAWDPADVNAELTYVGGGLYERTFKFTELAEDLTIADTGYKVAFNDGWDYSIGVGSGAGAGNVSLTLPAGSTSLTVVVDRVNEVLYDSGNTADFETSQSDGSVSTWPALDTTINLIGDVRGDADNNWNSTADGYEFTQISDTLFRYQKDFAAGTYNYKCTFELNGEAKWYEKEAGNRTFVLTEDTHVVFLYDTETGYLYDTVNNTSAVGQLLGMEAAPAEMKVINNANGTTKFVALADEGAAVTLYYGNKADVEANGEAALQTASTKVASDGSYQTSDIFLGDDALDIVYYYDVNGTRTLDGSNPTVTIGDAEYSNYTREAFTGRLVCVPGTFPGPSWNAATNEMTYLGNGLYEYVFENVPAATYEYKIAMGSWNENYGADGKADGANIAVQVAEQMDEITIMYNDFSHRAVCSIDYVIADITLSGTGIPEGTKLTDEMLTGIYSVTLPLTAGTYSDLVISYDGNEYPIAEFELEEDKDVTFMGDPITGIYYHDAGAEVKDGIYFDSKDELYKDPYGAVEAGENVTFTITTEDDAAEVLLVFKGKEQKTVKMEEVESEGEGKKFTVTTSLDTIGEYKYYFVIKNTEGNALIYTDDDAYYGTGEAVSLANLKVYYDLVVYEKGFETPDWMKNAVIYQIFPDRFYDGDESNNTAQTHARGAVDYEYMTDWYVIPENPEQQPLLDQETYESYGAYWGDGEWSNEIYGGDLQGIIERIDYLKALGVNVIYLNPVFTSISSHRYDTSDYMEIDPILGTEGDFAELVEVAEANGMKIILDGVFNHVSDDSIYFDRYYRYLGTSEKIGAYPYWAYVYDLINDEGYELEAAEKVARDYFENEYGITDFSYTEWFDIFNSQLINTDGEAATDSIGLRAGKPVYSYDGWWGYDSMPVVKSTNGSEYQTGTWAEEIIYSEDESSVTQYWLTEGNNGWRLDVANEVSDETWQNFRDSVKALDSEAVIVGEIWTDATKYLMGDMYDSVMNYVFRGAVTGFAMGTSAEETTNTMEKLRERYPEEAFYAMMNLVASHDTSRVLSYLDGVGDDRADKSAAAAFPSFETTSDAAKDRQKLVAFLQFTYAGAPTIYYGDEVAMAGADDPDDRRGFTWGKGDKETVLWYAELADIRSQYSALRTGSVETFVPDAENLMGYVRRDDSNALIVVANNATESKQTVLSLAELNVEGTSFTDLISGITYTADADGSLTVDVPAVNGVILVESSAAVTTSVDEEALAPAYDESYIVAERSVDEPTKLPYTDVAEYDFYYDAAVYAYENGIMTGLNETTFGGGELLSRAQFATILHRVAGTPEAEYVEGKFADVVRNDMTEWFIEPVMWASEKGIITGYSNGLFGPSDSCTREQMITMMYRYAKVSGYDVSATDDLSGFPDAASVSEFAKEAMRWAVAEGLISGDNGYINPQGVASRAHTVVIIKRYMDNVVNAAQ